MTVQIFKQNIEMVNVNRGVDKCSVKSSIIREMGKDPLSSFFQTFLEILTEGGVETEAGNLFQYLTTLT